VWTEKELFVERIRLDSEFCEDMVAKSREFFKHVILPELIGKLYSNPKPLTEGPTSTDSTDSNNNSVREDLICTCQTVYKESDNVIGCDNENCPYVWLHFKCAGIRRVPKGKWLCKHCRSKK
jgi:hypothetical protein